MTDATKALLLAIRDDQYTDGAQGAEIEVWTFSVMVSLADAGFPKASHGGIVSAAVKAGLVGIGGGTGKLTDDDATIYLTEAGFEAIGPRA
jgi:hypothetical protein